MATKTDFQYIDPSIQSVHELANILIKAQPATYQEFEDIRTTLLFLNTQLNIPNYAPSFSHRHQQIAQRYEHLDGILSAALHDPPQLHKLFGLGDVTECEKQELSQELPQFQNEYDLDLSAMRRYAYEAMTRTDTAFCETEACKNMQDIARRMHSRARDEISYWRSVAENGDTSTPANASEAANTIKRMITKNGDDIMRIGIGALVYICGNGDAPTRYVFCETAREITEPILNNKVNHSMYRADLEKITHLSS